MQSIAVPKQLQANRSYRCFSPPRRHTPPPPVHFFVGNACPQMCHLPPGACGPVVRLSCTLTYGQRPTHSYFISILVSKKNITCNNVSVFFSFSPFFKKKRMRFRRIASFSTCTHRQPPTHRPAMRCFRSWYGSTEDALSKGQAGWIFTVRIIIINSP